jgi:hypothetical protein
MVTLGRGLIGRIGERTWSTLVTHRSDKIRIVSVRRAQRKKRATSPGRRARFDERYDADADLTSHLDLMKAPSV